MLIKDYLKDYEAQDSYHKLTNHFKLRRLLKKLAEQDNSFGILCSYILDNNVGLLTPQSIQDTCDKLFGITTIEGLQQASIAINWKKFNNIMFPTVSKPAGLPKVTANELSKIIKNSGFELAQGYDLMLVDREYELLTEDLLYKILDKCPYNKLKYQSTVFDCDDFAFTMKAWVSLHLGGGVSFGYAQGLFFDENNKFLFSHAFNICVLDTKKVCLVEPQNDMIVMNRYQISDWFKIAKTLKLTFVYV